MQQGKIIIIFENNKRENIKDAKAVHIDGDFFIIRTPDNMIMYPSHVLKEIRLPPKTEDKRAEEVLEEEIIEEGEIIEDVLINVEEDEIIDAEIVEEENEHA